MFLACPRNFFTLHHIAYRSAFFGVVLTYQKKCILTEVFWFLIPTWQYGLPLHCIPDQLHGITTHGAGTGIIAVALRPQNLVDYFIINEHSEVCLRPSYHRPGLIFPVNLNLAII